MHSSHETSLEKNLAQYRVFARNPLRTKAEVEKDFYLMLDHHPLVTALGFAIYNEHMLLIQTPAVHINYAGKTYYIGRFMLMLLRAPRKRGWSVDYRLVNLDGTKEYGQQCDVHHPHIFNLKKDEVFGTNVGRLCISQGHDKLEKRIREGRILETLSIFEHILTVYPTGKAFLEVENWQEVKNEC